MFRAIGIVIVLLALVKLFPLAMGSLESALAAVFNTMEAAANSSTNRLID